MDLPHSKADAEREFWNEVEELLTGQYRHPARQAREGIDLYKSSIGRQAKHGAIPEAVYNQGEVKAAEVIDGVIRTGLPRGPQMGFA